MSEFFAVFRWWLVLMGIGIVATPLCWRVFDRLPSRGYPYAKMLGLLLVSYLFWLLGSFGFVGNTTGGIVVAAGLVAGLSVWSVTQLERPWRDILLKQLPTIIITELIFLAIFLLWAWARAQNPSITATEKPMEFAFLNSAVRSDAFPPLDPWLSGFSISYYYFGYVMTSVLVRLAAVPTAIGFNLGIAWLAAGAGIGAFGLVHDLIALMGDRSRKFALGLGLIAAFAVPLAGNLTHLVEMAYSSGIGSDQFWSDLDVKDLNTPPDPEATPRYKTSQWWWWRSSRVIHEYHFDGTASGLTPIAEFPGFSFVLGDMHPHVLALPFAFLSMAVALTWYLQTAGEERQRWYGSREKLLLTAVVVGGLSFLNTWDVIIYLFLIVGAFALAQWRDNEGWALSIVPRALMLAVLLAVGAYLLYLPFYLGFNNQAGAPYILPMMMRPTRLPHLMIIFGLPLTVLTVLAATLVIQQKGARWKSGVLTITAVLGGLTLMMLLMGWIIGAAPTGSGQVLEIARQLGVDVGAPGESGRIGWALSAIAKLTLPILRVRLAVPFATLLLATLIGSCVMITSHLFGGAQNEREQTSHVPFLLLLVLTAALLTIGPEFLYLKDNFGQRLNTVFKFYYQAWAMFGVAAPVAVYVLLRRARVVGLVTAVFYVCVFAGTMLFPYYAVQSRAMEFRGSDFSRPPTLDGLAYVNADERDAQNWLAANADNDDVVVEAVGGAYSGYARVAANTGVQTLLGWANHERQWRGDTFTQAGRDNDVKTIYTDSSWLNAPFVLDRFSVDYVYVGDLERQTYGESNMEDLANNMQIAYQNNSVTIYSWGQ